MDNDLYKVLPDSTNNLEDLEKWKSEYDGIPYEHKLRSDDMSTEKYGSDNMSRYNRLKAIFDDKVDPNNPKNNIDEATISSDVDELDHSDWENKIARARDAEANGLIIMVDTNYELHGENTEDSINLLKDKWDKFQLLPEDLRTLSNNTAYNIFGMDNYKLYDRILNSHLNDLDHQANDIELYTAPNTTIKYSTKLNPYDITDDTIDSNSSDVEIECGYEWVQSLTRLCEENRIHKSEELDNQIIKMGWNPEIPFTENAASRTWVRYADNITCVDAKEYLTEVEAIGKVTHTYEELKDKIVPVFVCLCGGISTAGKLIRWFTDSKWSHAAMGFNSSLEPLYSFNLHMGKVNGFSIEGLSDYKKLGQDARIKVYALFVTPEQKKNMEDTIQWYIDNQKRTHYSVENIIAIALRRLSKHADDKDKMICSQFVYSILKLANFKMRKTKHQSTVSPADIDELADDARFFAMYEGELEGYDPKQVDKLCKDIIPTLPMEYYGIDEATGTELYRVKSAIRSVNPVQHVFEMADKLLGK